MSIRRTTAAMLLALVWATACTIERTPRADAADPDNVARAEIELMLRNYQQAVLDGDARRAAAVFTPTARMYLPDATDATGRGEIDSTMAARFDNERVVGMLMEYDPIDVDAGIAHQFGRVHERIRDADGDEREVDGRFAVRWVRAADAAWRMDRLIINRTSADSIDAQTDAH